MTFHAPQSSARLVAIIARRALFNRSTLIAAGALASTSVVFAERSRAPDAEPHLHSAAAELMAPRLPGAQHPGVGAMHFASASPFTIPSALGRPWKGDLIPDAPAADDGIAAATGEPALPRIGATKDMEPEMAIGDEPQTVFGNRPSIRVASLDIPEPDWGTLDSVLGPRFPEVGPAPLPPKSPEKTARDTAPEITDTETGPRLRTFSAEAGETFKALLERAGVRETDREATLVALRADTEDDALGEGDEIDLAFARDEDTLLGIRLRQEDQAPLELRWDGETDPLWAALTMSDAEAASLAQPDSGTDLAVLETLEEPSAFTDEKTAFISGEITSSLYAATSEAGLTPADAVRLANIFRYIVDFERDLRKGDRFEALFEKDPDGGFGAVLYAKLTNRGSDIALYRGTDEFGETGYFDVSGKTNLRSIMRTPVAGAQISSHYGMRMHPILGYNKMHRGVDFAAPRGTPIFAAGNGVVEYVGRRGAYGKYVRIRHNSTFKTAYAHMSGYADGLNTGDRVRQGEVIGYVGSTGRSTGPHLHFEILQDGQRVNPMAVADFGPEKVLSGPELSRFKVQIARIEVTAGLHRGETRVATSD